MLVEVNVNRVKLITKRLLSKMSSLLTSIRATLIKNQIGLKSGNNKRGIILALSYKIKGGFTNKVTAPFILSMTRLNNP